MSLAPVQGWTLVSPLDRCGNGGQNDLPSLTSSMRLSRESKAEQLAAWRMRSVSYTVPLALWGLRIVAETHFLSVSVLIVFPIEGPEREPTVSFLGKAKQNGFFRFLSSQMWQLWGNVRTPPKLRFLIALWTRASC